MNVREVLSLFMKLMKSKNNMNMKQGETVVSDKIQNAYHNSKNIYDDVLTQRHFLSRLYIRLFWSETDDNAIARKLLSYIPDNFSGVLLDVPVGTAVFTHQKWSNLTHAKIICLDYSEDMLAQSRMRLKNATHVSCIQGDVGNLPLENDSCDIVLCMNGFHAFLDKEKAFQEIWRVLKPKGQLLACFYIQGEVSITDWFVKNILVKKGWFTPPFYTKSELKEELGQMYQINDFYIDGSMVYFECIK